jgi:hypothetical protein
MLTFSERIEKNTEESSFLKYAKIPHDFHFPTTSN